jgi:tetratricopeptide (TPR) repeat protein
MRSIRVIRDMQNGPRPYNALGAVTILALLFFASSCSISSPHLSVLQGNHAFNQGNYQAATVHYLAHWGDGNYDPWIAYNLGNVYHFLGEFDVASEMWDAADDSGDADLRFSVAFNKGVMAYELGRYNRAFVLFRDALLIDSTSVAAKRNLELALRKMEAGEGIDGQDAEEGNTDDRRNLSGDAVRILEYVRRKEGTRWVAPEETAPTREEPTW